LWVRLILIIFLKMILRRVARPQRYRRIKWK
jgi:hypothetical protein